MNIGKNKGKKTIDSKLIIIFATVFSNECINGNSKSEGL